MTGTDEVAQIVFAPKRLLEVQYLRATITEEQRQEWAALVGDTVPRIDSGVFRPHSGIRFQQNPCTTCPFNALCPHNANLIETALRRNAASDRGLFGEFVYY